MPNITLSIDDDLLDAGRKYAREHNTSLNALMRDLLARTVTRPSSSRMRDMFKMVDSLRVNPQGKKWTREDAYDA
jgi:hypothetical protein